MSVCLSTFLCPNSNTKPSTKYMGALVDVELIKKRNWCSFVHKWLLVYIAKYLKQKAKLNRVSLTLGGCIYHLVVRCLDFMDFGLIQMSHSLPRIHIWKGELIKLFSDMAIGKNGNYGSRPIKEESETCYACDAAGRLASFDKRVLKDSIDAVVGNHVADKVKEDIIMDFVTHMKDQPLKSCNKAHLLLLDVMRKLTAIPESMETIKVDGSESLELSNELENNVTSNSKRPRTRDDEVHVGSKRARSYDTEVRKEEGDGHYYSQQSMGSNNALDKTAIRNRTDERQMNMFEDRIEETKKEQSVIEKSVSLDHMIKCSTDSKKEAQGNKIEASSCVNPITALPNQQPHDEEINTHGYFSGFMNNRNKQINPSLKPIVDLTAPQQLDIDQKLFEIEFKPGSPMTRRRVLEEARKKYRFKDDSVPSYRIYEGEDDYGTNIEEAELWRPIGISDNEYNKLVEDNIAKADAKSEYTHKETVSSIQCAQQMPNDSVTCVQKLPSYDCLTDNPRALLKDSEQRYKFQGKTVILGRKLFTDEFGPRIEDDLNMTPHNEINDQVNQSSPEIQFIGEKNFKMTCNNMTMESDSFYNTRLTLGSSNSTRGKENCFQQKRLIPPSKYIVSPYDNFPRSSITAQEAKLYECLTTICDLPEFQDTWAINIDNCTVSLGQLGKSFKSGGWVEAYVINAFCRKLFRDNHPRKSNKHYFFHTSSEYFLEKYKSEAGRLRWRDNVIRGFIGAGSAKKLHLVERLYFPAEYESHWFVFAVDLKARNFIFLDPLFGENSSYHLNIREMMINNFTRTWQESEQKNIEFQNFGRIYPRVPKQIGGDDCGVFALKLMELWCPRNPMSCIFSMKDIPYFRMRLALDNLFSEHNKEEAGKNLIQNFNLKEFKINSKY